MPKLGKALGAGLVGLLLSGCQGGVPKSARQLTSAQIQQAVGAAGQTVWGHDSGGNDFVAYRAPDGTMAMQSGTFTDHGVWRVVPGNKICLKWHKIRDGVETCLREYTEGNDIYNVLPDGSVASVVTRERPGNPDHL